MNLYEISVDYRRFQEQVESGEIPEDAIADTLEAIEGNFDDKVDSIACIIKSLLAEAKEIKSERDALDGRMKQKQKVADRLTKTLKDQMLFSGRTKVETRRNVVKVRNNPPSVEIDNEQDFISFAQENELDSLLNYSQPKPNKTAIKDILKDGAELPGVRLVGGKRLDIK